MKSIRVKLEKILGGKRVRTNTVEGFCYRLPEEGSSFIMLAESLSSDADFRNVTTSTVKNVEQVQMTPNLDPVQMLFQTQNSVYRLHINREDLEESLMDGGHNTIRKVQETQ